MSPAPRPLGQWALIALVVGNMIGSGVFLLPATLAPYGAASLLGWAVTLCGALLLAVVYAWLARAIRNHGGAYGYARHAFGDGPGFLVAWSYWICTWTANAAIAGEFFGRRGFSGSKADPSPALPCKQGREQLRELLPSEEGASVELSLRAACTAGSLPRLQGRVGEGCS